MVCERVFGSDAQSWFAEHPRTKRVLAVGVAAITFISPIMVSRLLSNDPNSKQREWIECADAVANAPQSLTLPAEFIVSHVTGLCGEPPASQ